MKKLLVLSFTLCILHFTLYNIFAQPVSSVELISNAGEYDGKAVAYEGEVIGDIMLRGEFAWINVNDGKNAIGAWVPKAMLKDLNYGGSYKTRGDWIEVSGIFHRACLQHGGDLDIHCQEIRKISAGRPETEKINTGKKILALQMLALLGIVWILSLLKIRLKQK
ncbi:MAG: DNA-binding protein [Candidatus Omnitrophica bacterium]|nr:DNA-binding protein [Candidatus Omnitrophota bacterium]